MREVPEFLLRFLEVTPFHFAMRSDGESFGRPSKTEGNDPASLPSPRISQPFS
jgi:hypothetical protein